MRYRWLLVCGLIALFVPGRAAGHGSVPLSENVTGLTSESDGDGWVLEANFGIITHESPRRYSCEEAFSGGSRTEVGVLGTDEWVIFTEDRILRTDDGCSFTKVKEVSTHVSDYAVDRETGQVAYVITGSKESELWVSKDRGASFSKVDIDASDLLLTQVEFVSDGRLLVSSYIDVVDNESPRGTAVLLVVRDGSIEKRTVVSEFQYPYVLEAQGDQFVWLAGADQGQNVIWGSVDAPKGPSHKVDSWPTGAAFEPSGDVVWISGVGVEADARGFLRGDKRGGEASFETAHPDHSAGCVGYAGDTLYACSRWGREGADLQELAGESFETLVDFGKLEGPRNTCPDGSDVAMACPTVWPELKDALSNTRNEGGDTGMGAGPDAGGDVGMDTGTSADGGRSDAGGDVGDQSDAGPSEDTGGGGSDDRDPEDGCSVGTEGGPVGPVGWVLAVFGVVAVRRRT